MLPFLAITYTAARLGLEAQSAAAFRLLRLGAGITKSADQIVLTTALISSVTSSRTGVSST